MQTLWTAKKKQSDYVKRDELPALMRETLVKIFGEIVLGKQPSIVPEPKPEPVKRPRAKGHTHRGVCGRLCFAGKSAYDR